MVEFLTWQPVKVIRLVITKMRKHYRFSPYKKKLQVVVWQQFGIPWLVHSGSAFAAEYNRGHRLFREFQH